MEKQIATTQSQLHGIGYDLDSIKITQVEKTYVYCTIVRFEKNLEHFTVELTPTGKPKKNSVRFYDTY